MEAQLPPFAAETAHANGAGHPAEHIGGDLRLLVWSAVLAQVLDAASGAWMMQTRGLAAELNPLIRAVFVAGGAPALVLCKAALALGAAALFVTLAGRGRDRLARRFLLLTTGVGLLGVWSNLP